MRTIKDLQSLFENYLIDEKITGYPNELYEPIRYMLSIGGKRLRPLLVLMAYEMFRNDAVNALPQAMAIEIFHNFTLVHDDIMDNAPLRRNEQTVFKKYNQNIAILSGDVMLVYAYNYLIKNQEKNIVDLIAIFNKTAIEVCEGQQLDLNFENNNEVTIEEYINMIELKTAVLLGAALKIGAINANSNDEDKEHLYQFGKLIGTSFQLLDDILDAFGDAEKFGKKVGGDIIQNKKTILFLEAIKNGSDTHVKDLQTWMKTTHKPEVEKIEAVKKIFKESGAEFTSRALVKYYHDNAMKHLDAVSVPANQKDILYGFSEMLLKRAI